MVAAFKVMIVLYKNLDSAAFIEFVKKVQL